MLSGDSTHCGARAPVLTVVLDQGRYQSAAAGPHSCKHTHIHRVSVHYVERRTHEGQANGGVHWEQEQQEVCVSGVHREGRWVGSLPVEEVCQMTDLTSCGQKRDKTDCRGKTKTSGWLLRCSHNIQAGGTVKSVCTRALCATVKPESNEGVKQFKANNNGNSLWSLHDRHAKVNTKVAALFTVEGANKMSPCACSICNAYSTLRPFVSLGYSQKPNCLSSLSLWTRRRVLCLYRT